MTNPSSPLPRGMPAPPSRKPLPVDDPSLDALSEEGRHLLADRWRARAENELATSTVFAEVYRGLVTLGAPYELLAMAARAVEDELRHAFICRDVACRYAAADVDVPRTKSTPSPKFAGCSEREARVLHVVAHACLNESVAVAYLGACLEQAKGELARAAVRELMHDEVEHARLGWAFLAWASPEDRALIERALPKLVAFVERLWISIDGYPEKLPEGHGCLGLAEVRSLVARAFDELVLPGFSHVGVSAAKVRPSRPV